MLRPSGGIQRRGGLLPGQSAYRDAPDGETGVIGIQLGNVNGARQSAAQDQDQDNQENSQNDHEFFHHYHPQRKSE